MEASVLLEGLSDRIDAWLAGLEGEKFDANDAEERINEIKRVVAASGRELVFEGQTVTLYAQVRANRKHAKVHVTTLRAKPQQVLHAKITLPRLTSRPITAGIGTDDRASEHSSSPGGVIFRTRAGSS
jgi:hypothetical protein